MERGEGEAGKAVAIMAYGFGNFHHLFCGWS